MFQIGPYTLQNRLILAPMAGVTDRPFRQLCREQGAGFAVSEMITSDTSLHGSRKTLRRLNHRGEIGPISVQIVGADPLQMARAAQINVDQGAQIIDINMGCPAKKVCKVAAGSALLKDEALVEKILHSVVTSVAVPVTLKIRTGWDQQSRNGTRIAHIAEQSGISAISVHGRTRACRFSGEAEYDSIRAIKAAVDIPVIANGDIDSPRKAQFVLQHTGADALMIGRAAQGRPWIFREIEHYLTHGSCLPEPDPLWIGELLTSHLHELYHLYGFEHGVLVARKHIGWYCKGNKGDARFRKTINSITSWREQISTVRQYFTVLGEQRDKAA